MSKFKLNRVLPHILFWIIVLVVNTFIFGRPGSAYISVFLHLLTTLPVYMGATYFTLYYILPKYLMRRKYLAAIVPTFYMLLATAFFQVILTIIFAIQVETDLMSSTQKVDRTSLDVFIRLIGIYIVVFIAATIKMLKHWYDMQQHNQELIKQKLEAELNFLKAQVNPHFLFNTLNNLYGLALTNSEKTPDMILKLSEMLDYFLYKCNSDKVLLIDEISMIKNYIELEQLRYSNRLKVNFTHQITNNSAKIAPLMIVPFIENAFKHSAAKSSENTYLDIDISFVLNQFKLQVKNSYNPDKKTAEISSGIGLENIKKRLELIYPDLYVLQINNTNEEFIVQLKIDSSKEA